MIFIKNGPHQGTTWVAGSADVGINININSMVKTA